jgi:hypothetical protein
MNPTVLEELLHVLEEIDRPGSFCVSGSLPVVLPGLEVEGFGPIGLPLVPRQAQELIQHCEQAPYGKGEETRVDTDVRRVWHLKPERFALTNPDWEPFLKQTLRQVREGLGLEKQKLESHLYDLLLYEPGSFFLPHKDGEKLPRMVATLVLVLPSSFRGGELIVRHEGEEQTVDFGGGDKPFRIHFAAFYADCEHEVRPLQDGYRLCLIYNLTLAKAKKTITAPRTAEYPARISPLLRKWAEGGEARKLVITLEHQYTQDGLTGDALKGADRVKARALHEAARQADCRAYLALLTLHESGSAEYTDGGFRGRGRRYRDDDPGEFVAGEVYETSLTAEHWSDLDGNRLPLGPLHVEEAEVLDPEAIEAVDPEEDFEGYTGNAGMTFDRWYRHAAIVVWPNARHFDILCATGSTHAVQALEQQVKQWQQAGPKESAALRTACIDFATNIIARWPENAFAGHFSRQAEPIMLLPLLTTLDEPKLVAAYLSTVLIRDAAVDPGSALTDSCQKYGWKTFQPALERVFQATTRETLQRNVRLLEQLCSAKPGMTEGWLELCETLAQAVLGALDGIDQEQERIDFRAQRVDRAALLAGLARALLATEQFERLAQVVDHALARPEEYPLTEAHVAALIALEPWLAQHDKQSSPAMSHWLDACCVQLEKLTAQGPQAPADFRRSAELFCKCADCAALKRFLEDPHEGVYRFSAREDRRRHLEGVIRQGACDVDLKTEHRGSPHTLVCTKNTASYRAKLAKYQHDQQHLATLRSIQKRLP